MTKLDKIEDYLAINGSNTNLVCTICEEERPRPLLDHIATSEDIKKHWEDHECFKEEIYSCDMCQDTGEIGCMEQVYPGEPHMADVGTQKCECQLDL